MRKLVWDKLDPHLTGCHTVILLPDGELYRLPWAALPGRKKGSYLIEDYALATAAYGQQLFGLLTDEPVSGTQLLVAGGIRYDQRNEPSSTSDGATSPILLAGTCGTVDLDDQPVEWDYLPGAEAEVAAIRGIWSQRGPTAQLAGGSPPRINSPEGSLAHGMRIWQPTAFLTHEAKCTKRTCASNHCLEPLCARNATVAARNPLLMTGIVLAGANLPPVKDTLGLPSAEDGILTAEEIGGLDLHQTELVSLSACETGLGDITAGQGVMGLARPCTAPAYARSLPACGKWTTRPLKR